MPKTEAEVNEAVLVDIGAIDGNLRPASQMRVELNREALERYTEKLDEMPPVELMFDAESNTYWVVDGAHTITSATINGHTEILAITTEGTFLDAYRLASRANAKHGVPLTSGDKTHRVKEALGMPALADTSKWTQQAVADLCGVTQQLVSKLDNRQVYNSCKPAGTDKGGRPRKPKDEPKTEPNGKPETNGHAAPTASAPAASEVSPEQTEAEANEKAAEKWQDHISQALNIVSSLERRGGVKALTEKWSRKHREHFAGQFRAVVEQWQMIISQIEETL